LQPPHMGFGGVDFELLFLYFGKRCLFSRNKVVHVGKRSLQLVEIALYLLKRAPVACVSTLYFQRTREREREREEDIEREGNRNSKR